VCSSSYHFSLNGRISISDGLPRKDLGTKMEVENGVKAGDEVVLNPPIDLGEGSRVSIPASDRATAAS